MQLGDDAGPDFPRVDVGPVPIALADTDDVLAWVSWLVEQAPETAPTRIVNHLAAHPTVEARRDPALADVLRRADLNVADGMGTVVAARLLSGTQRPRERVYGPDAMLATLEHGLERGWRHAFVGGTTTVLPRLVERLTERLDGLRIVGAHAPPFRAVDADTVVEDLKHLAPTDEIDVLWVGLGVPKQLVWADLARPLGPARVIATVGAAFDFHAGAVSQAPAWMQARGLEWAYRLGQDPRRLARRYLVGNARHVFGVASDMVARRRAGR